MANEKFELRGINHLALVCKDMHRTVDSYEGVLGMPLIKTINLPQGSGQHFFSTPAMATRWHSSGSRRPVERAGSHPPRTSAGSVFTRHRACFHEPRGV